MSDQGSPKEVESERRSQSPSPRGGGDASSPRDRESSRSPVAREDDSHNNGGQAPDADAVNPGNNIYVANLPHRVCVSTYQL